MSGRYICGEGNKAEWQKGQGTFESLKSHRAVARGQKEEVKLSSSNPTGPCGVQSGV